MTNLNYVNIPQKSDYAVTSNGHIHVHSMQRVTPEDEELHEGFKNTTLPTPLEIHFDESNFDKSIAIYDANEFEQTRGGEIVAGFAQKEMLQHKYIILVTGNGKILKFRTKTFLAHKHCFFAYDIYDDFIGHAFLTDGERDIILVNNLGNAVIFSEKLVPEYDKWSKPEGFETYMTNPRSLFNMIVIAALAEDSSEEEPELLALFENGYCCGIDQDDIFRVNSEEDFTQDLWKNKKTKLLPTSKKYGSLVNGGYMWPKDVMLIYAENDHTMPIQEDDSPGNPYEFTSLNDLADEDLFSSNNKINGAVRFTQEEWFEFLEEMQKAHDEI